MDENMEFRVLQLLFSGYQNGNYVFLFSLNIHKTYNSVLHRYIFWYKFFSISWDEVVFSTSE